MWGECGGFFERSYAYVFSEKKSMRKRKDCGVRSLQCHIAYVLSTPSLTLPFFSPPSPSSPPITLLHPPSPSSAFPSQRYVVDFMTKGLFFSELARFDKEKVQMFRDMMGTFRYVT